MRRSLGTNRLWAVLLAIFASAGTSQATTCGHDYCWGAIGAGKGGIVARASGFRTAPEAYDWAERQCRGKCLSIEPYVNGCAAIAENFDGIHHFGFAESQDTAIDLATESCAASDRRLGWIRVKGCSK